DVQHAVRGDERGEGSGDVGLVATQHFLPLSGVGTGDSCSCPFRGTRCKSLTSSRTSRMTSISLSWKPTAIEISFWCRCSNSSLSSLMPFAFASLSSFSSCLNDFSASLWSHSRTAAIVNPPPRFAKVTRIELSIVLSLSRNDPHVLAVAVLDRPAELLFHVIN